MPGKKKKQNSDDGGVDEAPKARRGTGKAMLLHAGLVVAGALGQKFLLSSPPAQVIIAPPIDGGIVVSASGSSGLDCTAVTAAGEATPHAKRSAEAGQPGGTADLPSMTINLADGHYLKVGITVELGDTIVVDEFSASSAKASDAVLNYFSTKSMAELSNDRHAAIKTELACLIDAAYESHDAEASKKGKAEPTVVGVLFREFLTS